MTGLRDLRDRKIVRLNAELFPPSPYERSLWQAYQINPVEVEANDPAKILQSCADCEGLFAVSVSLPTRVIEGLERCRVISRMGIGTDKIDVESAARRGILVTNVPGFCKEEQADHTMMFMLALERKLQQQARAMREGTYAYGRSLVRDNHRVSSRTLGLIGFGDSGRETAKRARGFGMRILATRRNMNAPTKEAEALGVEMVDLDTLLAESDYVSLHLPLSHETYHLLDDAQLRKMKPGAFLLNTSRGALVDENALVAALKEGLLGGAGIDTWEQINVFTEDEHPSHHPLLEFENVVASPHVAAGSVEGGHELNGEAVKNLVTVLSGYWPDPSHIVNRGVVPRVPLEPYQPGLFDR